MYKIHASGTDTKKNLINSSTFIVIYFSVSPTL